MESPCLIVGLGNPGPEYTATRHNAGFLLLDLMAKAASLEWKREKQWTALISKTARSDWMLKPLTFMNRSGDSVQPAAHFYKIPAERILVIYDDLALPLGKLRIRTGGSAGGHNGMKSIIERLGTQEFPRVRIGIGTAPGDTVGHVLGRFSESELPLLRSALIRASEAVACCLTEGVPAAMNRFNSNQTEPT